MMLRKILSLAMALGMLGTAFLVFAVPVSAADTPGGQITTNKSDGSAQDLFFPGNAIYFQVEYKIGTYLTGAPIDVRVRDIGGNSVGTINYNGPTDSNYDWVLVYTNISEPTPSEAGFFNSWTTNVMSTIMWFETNGAPGQNGPMLPGQTYYIEARQHNTSEILFSSPLSILQQGIVITPHQDVYVPGQTVNINVTVQWNNKINVNISKINDTWINQTLTDYSWNVDYVIPESTAVGRYTIWVNQTWPNWQIKIINPAAYFDVGYFTLDVSTDKEVYLPGEQAKISWLARSVVDKSIADVDLQWNMEYIDGLTGVKKWSNSTSPYSDSPFTLTLPSQANINNEIKINATMTQANKSASSTKWIYLGYLSTTVTTDKASYKPGEVVIVTANVDVQDESSWRNAPEANATVAFKMYNMTGVLEPVNISSVNTDASGTAQVTFTIPANQKAENGYKIVGTTTILGFSDIASATIDVEQLLDVTVLTDKLLYTSGENMVVNVKILQNGVKVDPDSIEYWIEFDSGIQTTHVISITNATSFVIQVPVGQRGDADVEVIVSVDGKTYDQSSNTFKVVPLILALGASKLTYYPGDTITFTVTVVGSSTGFTLRYDIWDVDNSPVQNGPLTLTSGSATFTLAISATDPSSGYKVRVIADNGAGVEVDDTINVELIADYLIDMKILTGPASASGAYMAGQELTISFKITKMSSELENLSVIKATVSLWAAVGSMPIYPILYGEAKTFTTMTGELKIILPQELTNGQYVIMLDITNVGQEMQALSVDSNAGGWNSNIMGGLSLSDLMIMILLIIVIIMMVWPMIKGRKPASAAAGTSSAAASKPAEAKQESYAPKSTVACTNCGSPIEVSTSKRPIEVMCPKCGKSQMVN
jgi:predicted RNA-binding Zn-ribbon protein involved in translation (DUF1610 family)